ncbi:MAG: sigma-54 dependent transcriptional regulator [Myxococcota bacterium]
MSEHILIVEDDRTLQSALARYLKKRGCKVESVTSCAEATKRVKAGGLDLVLCDVTLPDGHCFEILDVACELTEPPGVVVMTADERIDHPIAAMQRGATDFLLKPFSFEALDRALSRAVRIAGRRRGEATGPIGAVRPRTPLGSWRERFAPEIVGESKGLTEVFRIIERSADTDCTVLVTGESGTGKELVARTVHRASERAAGPMVTLNCAAIPENLLESELFGHVRGAFTGAATSRDGAFVAADGGTLFLDEIGEMPLPMQAKLLRALQEREVTPVGDTKTKKVDVRIVAATNRDLDEAVAKGEFREDLLYRLDVIPVELPPLRARRGDVALLLEAFVAELNESRKRAVDGFTDEALAVLQAYEWPGNVRQLRNVVERLIVLKGEGRIGLDDLPRKLRKGAADSPAYAAEGPALPDDGLDLRDAVEQFENTLILQALERTRWNKNQAASILRMNRTTLVEKLKKKKLAKPVALAG